MAKGAVTASSRIPVTKSSGNVFAELEVAEPEEELAWISTEHHLPKSRAGRRHDRRLSWIVAPAGS